MKYQISVKAVIRSRDGTQLLVAQEIFKKQMMFAFLGGVIEDNESLEDCLKREMKEEAGFTALQINSKPILVWTGKHHSQPIQLVFIFLECKIKNYKDFKKSRECQNYIFINSQTKVNKDNSFQSVRDTYKSLLKPSIRRGHKFI